MSSPKVWLVTGASSGIGTAITISALRAGHLVLAGARNPEKAAQANPEVEKLGGRWLKLDVTSPTSQQEVHDAVEKEGRIDVLVNNAGYFLVGTIEDLSDRELYDIMDTHFHGAVRMIKAVLPFMRAQKSGVIANNSSVLGLTGAPACVATSASKHALEGLTESLALDLAPFGIRMVIFEAGIFRTPIFSAVRMPEGGISEPYQTSTVGSILGAFGYVAQNPEETQPGDPKKLADRVVEFIDGTGMAKGLTQYLRLPLGTDCVNRLKESIKELSANVDALEQIAANTAHDGFENAGEKGAMTIPIWSHATPTATS